MPIPAAHLAYGQQYLEGRPELDRLAFLRGTIFPDIRYLAGIDRNVTHRPLQVDLEQVAAETNSWWAGLLFHNWVDDAWNGYFKRHGLDYDDPTEAPTWMALKLLEDTYVRRLLRDAGAVASGLDVADEEAAELGLDTETTRLWGRLMARQLRAGQPRDDWEPFARDGLRFDEQQVADLRARFQRLEHEGAWGRRLAECWVALSEEFAPGTSRGR